MGAIEIIINVLAIIGFITLLGYLGYLTNSSIQSYKAKVEESKVYPPNEYMQQSGIRCPDYWVNTGIDDSGNYKCKNSFQLPVTKNSESSCLNVNCQTSDEISFAGIPDGYTWISGDPNGLTSLTDKQKIEFLKGTLTIGKNTNIGRYSNQSRCDWLKCCGPSMGSGNPSNAVWLGVSNMCSASTEVQK